MKTNYDDIILQVANLYGLPFDLLQAQVMVESSANPNAFRFESGFYTTYIANNPEAKAARFGPLAACSFGLMQIMLEEAYELGFEGRPEDLFVPRIGLTWGAKDLKRLWAVAGGDDAAYRTALAAYNGGDAKLKVQPSDWPPGVKRYVSAVYQKAGRV